jgi:hypothetical protein
MIRSMSRNATLGLAIFLSLAGFFWLGPARHRLDLAEARWTALSAIAAGGMAPTARLLPVDDQLEAANHDAAEAELGGSIREAAERAGLLIEAIGDVSGRTPELAERRIRLSGSEQPMLKFVEAVENRRPLVRFSRWRLAPTRPGSGAVRLDADAAAVWSQQP